MPAYFVNAPVMAEHAAQARKVWSVISGNGGEHYEASINDRRISDTDSCLTWFYNVFTERMRVLSPDCSIYTSKTCFADTRLLLQVIVVVLSLHNQRDANFKSRLQKLCNSIELYSITFYDLSVLGDALFHSLSTCLGDEYTTDIDTSWKVLYSAFLSLMASSNAMKKRSDTFKLSHRSEKLNHL